MTAEDKARAAADAVLADLGDRKGFDWWWDDIDEETQEEIRTALADCIGEVYR